MNRRKLFVGGAGVLGTAAVAATVMSGVAVGQTSPTSTPIILSKTGTVVDRGVAARVHVMVACNSGDSGFVYVTLSERSGKTIAQGSGSNSFNCTGQIEGMNILVTAGNGYGGGSYAPFVPGTALGQATLQDCSPNYYCNQGSTQHNVTLKAPK